MLPLLVGREPLALAAAVVLFCVASVVGANTHTYDILKVIRSTGSVGGHGVRKAMASPLILPVIMPSTWVLVFTWREGGRCGCGCKSAITPEEGNVKWIGQ